MRIIKMIKLKNILIEEVAQTEFVPVKLDWKFKDYEPAFDAETMKLHYEKHYKGYIDKLNKSIKEENIPSSILPFSSGLS